jgi:Putative transmembrane protein (PGPGW)
MSSEPMTSADRNARSRASAARGRVRAHRVGGPLLKVFVAVFGAGLVLLGVVAIALPGPLTIPPMVAGLYVLASEFAWAERWRDRAQDSGRKTWEQARRRPVVSGVTTALGLVLAGVALWAVGHYDLVARGRDAVGV